MALVLILRGECKNVTCKRFMNAIPIREQAKTDLDRGTETAPFTSFMNTHG